MIRLTTNTNSSTTTKLKQFTSSVLTSVPRVKLRLKQQNCKRQVVLSQLSCRCSHIQPNSTYQSYQNQYYTKQREEEHKLQQPGDPQEPKLFWQSHACPGDQGSLKGAFPVPIADSVIQSLRCVRGVICDSAQYTQVSLKGTCCTLWHATVDIKGRPAPTRFLASVVPPHKHWRCTTPRLFNTFFHRVSMHQI